MAFLGKEFSKEGGIESSYRIINRQGKGSRRRCKRKKEEGRRRLSALLDQKKQKRRGKMQVRP